MADHKTNKATQWIADLLRSQSRPKGERKVGIEIERIGLFNDLSPLQYSNTTLPSGNHRPGAKSFLETLSQKHQWPTINNSLGQPLGLTTPIGKVSLEPGSQVELSTNPFSDLITIKQKVDQFETMTAEVTEPWGLFWTGLGVNPIHKVSDIELIPSTRYKIMDEFLNSRGSLGTSMMRLTSSVQINLDYTNEQEAIEMLRVALLLSPLSYALFSNSPFSLGKVTPYQSFRANIWQNTDPSRTGLLPEAFEKDFSFDDYANYLWNEPLMFVQDSKNQYVAGQGFSLAQIDNNKLPGIVSSEQNRLNAVRELFSDARIKLGYIEIRSIDGLTSEYRYAASAFWLGVLYSQAARTEVFRIFGRLTSVERQELFNSAITIGLKAKCESTSLSSIAEQLLKLAERELQSRGYGEEVLLEPLKENLKTQDNPATILLKKFKNDWNSEINKVIKFTSQK